MHEVCNRADQSKAHCNCDLIGQSGLTSAGQDQPKPFESLHQLWGAGGGQEALRGSCSGKVILLGNWLMMLVSIPSVYNYRIDNPKCFAFGHLILALTLY